MNGEEELPGGYSTRVVRLGDTVRRAMGPWSPTVHKLLRHLEERGFDGAPRFLGVDEGGREILTYLEGVPGNYPLPDPLWSDAALAGAARLLRRYHDATVGYAPPQGAVWRLPVPAGPREVFCHNDFAPYNVVYREGRPAAVIDFDTVTPGPRLWDVSYAAYRFVPLCRPDHAGRLGFPGSPDQAGRLRLFCDAYGLSTRARDGLIPTLLRRLEALCDLMRRSAARQDPWALTTIAEGHLDLYLRDLRYLRSTPPSAGAGS